MYQLSKKHLLFSLLLSPFAITAMEDISKKSIQGSRDTDLNFTCSQGNNVAITALHTALALHLIYRQGNIATKALHIAAMKDNIETTKTLIKLADKDALKLLFMQDEQGNTALHLSTIMSNTETIKTLMEAAGDSAFKLASVDNANGDTALHIAVAMGNVATIAKICQHQDAKDLISQRNNNGDLPIHLAAEGNYASVIDVLIQIQKEAGEDPWLLLSDCNNNYNDTALHIAVMKGNIEATKTLIKLADKNVLKLLFMQDKEGNTALHVAVKNNQSEMIKILMEAAGDSAFEFACVHDINGSTALHIAVSMGSMEATKALIKSADKNALKLLFMQDKQGLTALHWEAAKGNTEIVKILMEAAGDSAFELASAQDTNGYTALHFSTVKSNTEIVEILMEAAGDSAFELASVYDINGDTAFHIAVTMGNIEAVKALIKLADKNASQLLFMQDKQGNTALHWSAIMSNTETIKTLMEAAGDSAFEFACVHDINGDTALHIAVTRGNIEVTKTLIKSADKNALQLLFMQDKQGLTALHWAAVKRNAEIIKILMEAAGDSAFELASVHDTGGCTAFHIALSMGDVATIAKICQYQDAKDLIFKQNNNGFLPIHLAAAGNHASVIDTLIQIQREAGKDPWQLISSDAASSGSTALHIAVSMGSMEATKALIKSADKNGLKLLFMQDKEGYTALHCAALHSNAETFKMLMEAAGDSAFKLASVHDIFGDTAIHIAARKNDIHFIKTLVRVAGDNVLDYFNIKNHCGKTSLDCTRQLNRINIEILKERHLQNQPKIKCSLCFDTKSGTECYILDCWSMNPDEPNHQGCIFCKECLVDYLDYHLKNQKSTHELICPNQKCAKKINEPDIYAITQDSKGLYKEFLDIMFHEFKINNQNQIKSCPTPNCEATYVIEGDDVKQSLVCLDCKKYYCGGCQYDHTSMTCQDAATVDRDCPDCATRHARNITCDIAAQINGGLTNLDNQQFKQCPNCKVFIEKNRGCNHMTCEKCRHEFCWICLSTYGATACSPTRCAVRNIQTGYFWGLINFR